MKILNNNNNNISITIKSNLNEKFSRNEMMLENNKSNLIKFNNNYNNKDDKSTSSDFINSIIERNKEMKERIDDVKLRDFDHLMKLEEQKSNIAKDIKDVCKNNKDKLSQWSGLDAGLDDILSGNTDAVLEHMTYEDVSKHLTTLQTSLQAGTVSDVLPDLKKYYATGSNSDMSFTEYKQSKGDDSTFNPELLPDDKKEDYFLLKSLKNSYKNLFAIDNAIKNFKKESKDRLEEMQKNMEKISGNFKANNNVLDDTLKNTKSQKEV